jgi:hypothetical protein
MLEKLKNLKSRIGNKKLRTGSRGLFWTWIAYQTIKGALTTTLIWIPALLAWLHIKN